MPQKRMFGARIDEEWIAQFEAIAAQRGVRASQIAREAFARYLGIEPGAGAGGDRTSDPARLERLEAAIEALTKRLERLERSERAIASREAPTSGQNLEPDSASAASTPSEWMTTREAWEAVGTSRTWHGFRQLKPEQLTRYYGLEVDAARRSGGDRRWLRITEKC